MCMGEVGRGGMIYRNDDMVNGFYGRIRLLETRKKSRTKRDFCTEEKRSLMRQKF